MKWTYNKLFTAKYISTHTRLRIPLLLSVQLHGFLSTIYLCHVCDVGHTSISTGQLVIAKDIGKWMGPPISNVVGKCTRCDHLRARCGCRLRSTSARRGLGWCLLATSP
ncbi:unnamed protein product, partial [Musa banksii]